jgi:hypothetical protein
VHVRRRLTIVMVDAMATRVTTLTWNEVVVVVEESSSASVRQTLIVDVIVDVDAVANSSRRGEVVVAVEEVALPWVEEEAGGVATVVETNVVTRTTSGCAWMKGTMEAMPAAIWIKAAVDTITTMKSKVMATRKGTDMGMEAMIKDMEAMIRDTTIIRLEVAGAEAFAADEAFEVVEEDVGLLATKTPSWSPKKTPTERRLNPTLWRPPRRQ